MSILISTFYRHQNNFHVIMNRVYKSNRSKYIVRFPIPILSTITRFLSEMFYSLGRYIIVQGGTKYTLLLH